MEIYKELGIYKSGANGGGAGLVYQEVYMTIDANGYGHATIQNNTFTRILGTATNGLKYVNISKDPTALSNVSFIFDESGQINTIQITENSTALKYAQYSAYYNSLRALGFDTSINISNGVITMQTLTFVRELGSVVIGSHNYNTCKIGDLWVLASNFREEIGTLNTDYFNPYNEAEKCGLYYADSTLMDGVGGQSTALANLLSGTGWRLPTSNDLQYITNKFNGLGKALLSYELEGFDSLGFNAIGSGGDANASNVGTGYGTSNYVVGRESGTNRRAFIQFSKGSNSINFVTDIPFYTSGSTTRLVKDA